MRNIEAFILAAGRSSRLGNLTTDMPKGLLEIGGRNLLDRSLEILAGAGLLRVHLVVGCNGDAFRAHLASSKAPLPVEVVENSLWESTGSVVSLALARRARPADWSLVLESDLLFHPGFVAHALEARRDTILVADASGSGDEVWVAADQRGDLMALGKGMSAEMRHRAIGEFAGISLFSRALLEAFDAEATRLHAAGQARGHYEELAFDLSQRGLPVAVHHCKGLPWTEIDTPADFSRAVERVLPRLAA